MKFDDSIRKVLEEGYPGAGKNKEEKPAAQGSSDTNGAKGDLVPGQSRAKPEASTAAQGSLTPNPAEKTPPKQGDSKDASSEDLGSEEAGKKASGKNGKQPEPKNTGAGAAPNYSTSADPKKVVNQSSSKGNVNQEEVEGDEEAQLSEEDQAEFDAAFDAMTESLALDEEQLVELRKATLAKYADKAAIKGGIQDWKAQKTGDPGAAKTAAKRLKGAETARAKLSKEEIESSLGALFTEDMNLSEDFKSKAGSLFEAVIIAKVAEHAAIVEEALQEAAEEALEEQVQALTEKVDAYLTYVAEQWVAQNKPAVQNMLRTEITEDFISGMRNLFAENYIEVPDEKFDVVGSLQSEVESLEGKLNTKIEEAVALTSENVELKRAVVFAQVAEGLADTQVEKFRSLTEDVSFESTEAFKEKLQVVRESMFPTARPRKTAALDESVVTETEVTGAMSAYAGAIGRAARFSKTQ